MKRIRIYAMTLLLMIVAAVAQAEPTTLPGSTGITDASVLKIWGSMYSGNGAGGGWDNWGGSNISAITVNGATVEKIVFNNNGGYVGYVLSNDGNIKVDVSTTTHMNVWIWADNTTYVGIEYQSQTSCVDEYSSNNHKYKSARNLQVTGGQWNLIRVALSDMPLPSGAHGKLTDIKNFSIVQDAQTEKTIYVSDIFFSREVVGSDVVDYDLINGQHYRLWDIDNTWEPMRDFFSPNVDGTYQFNAITGKYRLTKVDANKFIKVEPLNDSWQIASYDVSTGGGAIWLKGDKNFGMPTYPGTGGWEQDRSFAMAQVAPKEYRTTMTIGKELHASTDNKFKLFQERDIWGADGFKKRDENNQQYNLEFDNKIFSVTDGGDISSTILRNHDVWQFDARVKDNVNEGIKLTANRVWLDTRDLQPAPTPTVDASKVLSVFSDAYTVNIGMKKSHWSNVLIWGPDGGYEGTVTDDANASHIDIVPRTYADDENNHFIALEFNTEASDNRGWLNLHFPTQDDLSEYKYLHLDVNDLDGLNSEIYIWPRNTNDKPAFDTNTQSVPALKFSLLNDRDANGWKSIDVPLSAILGLDGSTALTKIDHIGIQAVGGVKGALAIDNVYFTKEKKTFTTYDDDKRGIDWNTATGTTCYVDQIVWTKSGTTANVNIVDTYNDNWAKIHDGDVHSYFQFNHDDTNDDNEHSQILIQLKDDIKVSDVEVIWANGYASRYAVYAFKNYPVVNGEIPAASLNSSNLLYSIGGYTSNNAADDIQMDHEPYFVTKSELQKKVTHDSRYLLLDLIKRGNGDTFGYYIDEIHAGAYDEDYDKPHHLNFPDLVIETELPPTELEVTVRNKRNAILTEWTDRIITSTVKTTWESSLLKKYQNSETQVYATAPGNHTVTVTGNVEGVTNLVPGTSTIKVYKNWRPASEEGNWKSLVQPRIENSIDKNKTAAENQTALNSIVWASQYENWGNPARTYYAWKAADGVEATDDHSRWSSAQEDTNNNNPSKQYWVIDLEHTYELTDVELVWERAIAKTYSVFGFTSLDGVDLGADYDTFLSTYGNANDHHLIYSYTMDNVLEYPYHDQHTNSSTANPVNEDNRARYLVIKTKETQSTKYYEGTSYSIWEVYAWGADVTVTDHVEYLKTPNLSVKVGHEGVVDVTAYGTKDDTYIEESEWHPVEFSVPATSKYVLINIPDEDESTGKTVDRFFFFEKVNGYTEEQYKQAYEDKTIKPLAYIVDNDNGTYGVKVMPGIAGLGQTEGEYDDPEDNGATDTKSITINMESTNTQGTTIKGQFELVIYKDAMKLLTDGTSSNKRQVYDDGYYSESVLTSNITAQTVSIDLRNVDFSYDNAGTALSSSVLPAPHTVSKTVEGSKVQLNPNTIYYTDETVGTISGGNLAFRQGEVWRVPVLRIFDGWDWSPITNEGGMIANKATFYTSIPAMHYSFIALPFVPNPSTVLDKGVMVYKPSIYRPERNAVKLDELKSTDFNSDFIGQPLVVYTEYPSLYEPNGYAVAFVSGGAETSVDYWPHQWSDNGATIIPSYTKQDLEASDASFDYYLYSIKYDQFMQVGSTELAEDQWNGDENSRDAQPHLSATQVMPFYAYMKVPKQASPAPAFTFMLTDDTETTGIDATNTETDESVRVYDVQGRYVSDSSRNLTPGIYIVKKADGSTRKVYIKK